MQLLLPLITALALSAKALAGSITGDSCLVNADVNLNVKGFLYVSLDIRFVVHSFSLCSSAGF